MVTFTLANQNPQNCVEINPSFVLQASRAIQRNWTTEERTQRVALAKKQTLRLMELVFGSDSFNVGP